MTPVVAAVGTTHPYLAAGLLLELTAIRALGARPVAVVAGVSAQDAQRVTARTPLDAATIAAQFAALATAGVRAVCIGALPGAAAVEAVAAGLERWGELPVICDPVFAASGGDRLSDDATVAALRAVLFARCTLLTPNLPEAEQLTGRPIASLAAMHAAMPALLALGPRAVLLKAATPRASVRSVADAGGVRELRAARLPHELRGTGSLLAAAIATRCAFGDSLDEAIDAARAFVRERIAGGVAFAGMRIAF